jgi:hypothetical protein
LWCCHNSGDPPQADLATFGYRPPMKYMLATCFEQCAETWQFPRLFIRGILLFLRKNSPNYDKNYPPKKQLCLGKFW